MTDVFVSYKREDEARVARLVRGLSAANLSVWWDRGLVGGEGWREQIEQALDAAKVVVVCWTDRSIDQAEGRFVRSEASRAGARLVQVMLDRKIKPPLGFDQDQALDLTGWGGNPRDPFFQDLIALVKAKRDGTEAPKPKGPMRRAMRRFVWGGGLTATILAVGGVLWSVPAAREGACALPVGQPGLSRACCDAGLTEKELMRAEAWTPAPRQASMYLPTAAARFPDEMSARADAEARLTQDAARTACAVAQPDIQRLEGVSTRVSAFDCREDFMGWTCAADYVATCRYEERALVEACP